MRVSGGRGLQAVRGWSQDTWDLEPDATSHRSTREVLAVSPICGSSEQTLGRAIGHLMATHCLILPVLNSAASLLIRGRSLTLGPPPSSPLPPSPQGGGFLRVDLVSVLTVGHSYNKGELCPSTFWEGGNPPP